MVKIIAGDKGEGKTKRLIDMANETVKTTDGCVVFIDSDTSHMYDLNRDIRLIETADFRFCDMKVFVGFIYGILSQNTDIRSIYVDKIDRIIESLPLEELDDLCTKLEAISSHDDIEIVLIISAKKFTLPDSVREKII